MTIKGTLGNIASLVVLAAVSGGVAGSALHQSAPTVRADQQAAAYAMAVPQDGCGSGQSNGPGCPGTSNTNWG